MPEFGANGVGAPRFVNNNAIDHSQLFFTAHYVYCFLSSMPERPVRVAWGPVLALVSQRRPSPTDFFADGLSAPPRVLIIVILQRR